MPQKRKTALSRKRTTLAKKKLANKKLATKKKAKSITRTPSSAAKAKVATPRKRKAASGKKKAAPRASTKQATKSKARRQSPASKAKSSMTTSAHPQRTQPRRRNARPESDPRGPRKAPSAKRGTVEIVERLVVDTVEEVAPGVLLVKEYEIESEVLVTPTKGGGEAV